MFPRSPRRRHLALLGLCTLVCLGGWKSEGTRATTGAETAELGPVLVLRTVPEETPFFYSLAAIQEIGSQGVAAFAASRGLPDASVEEILAALASRLNRLESLRSEHELSEAQPCLKPVPDRFAERRTYLRSAEEVVNGDRLPLAELIRRSPHAVIGEVTEVVPGLHTPFPTALVRVRVVERLTGDEGILGPGSEFLYLSDFYDFEVRGRRVCASNSDFFFPSREKLALFLLPAEDPSLGLYDPHAEFELVDGELVIHPYPMVSLEPRRLKLAQIEA